MVGGWDLVLAWAILMIAGSVILYGYHRLKWDQGFDRETELIALGRELEKLKQQMEDENGE